MYHVSAQGVDERMPNVHSYSYFYFREEIQTVIKPRFYPRFCQFLMKKLYQSLAECAHASRRLLRMVTF